jgi:outer membrane protein TolC
MKHLVSLSLFLAVVRLIRAEAPPPEAEALALELTPQFVNALAEEARTNNPALLAAGARTEAAAANVASVRGWEDPMVMLGGMFADSMMREEDGDLLYGVQQKLPLFGRPRAMRRMAERERAVMEADRDAMFQERRRDLAQALFRTAYLQRAADIGSEDLAWLASMVRTTEDRYRVGETPQTYLLRLQNEHARRADAFLTDQRRVVEALAGVNRLLGRPIDSAWPRLRLPPVADEVTYNERLVELALAQEPRLQTLREAVRVADAAVELSRRMRSPEVIAGVEARNYTGNGDFRQAMVTLSVSLPWLNGGKYGQDIRRETARRQAAELDVTDSEWRVREEVRRLTVGIDAARREALLYRDQIVPRSAQALDSAQASWIANRAMFLDVMESRRMLIEARLMYARAVSEQYQMLSELVLCCGLGDLEALVMIGASAPPPTRPHP